MDVKNQIKQKTKDINKVTIVEETQSQTETAEAVAALTDQINQDINKVTIVEETQSQTETAEAVAALTDQINQDINKVI